MATPIGNLKDITLRALEILKSVDGILCEDTRVTRKLLSHYGISKPLFPYHDHNAERMRGKILEDLLKDKTLALVSDAGTPLISDPGYKLVQACLEENICLSVIPGPSAILSALVLSGMPTDSFFFAGFANPRRYPNLKEIPATLIFFEAPSRLLKTLPAMEAIFKGRTVAVVRELTKIYEEVKRGSFSDLIMYYQKQGLPKGEAVIVLSPPPFEEISAEDIALALRNFMRSLSLKEAVEAVSSSLQVSKKRVYQIALEIKEEEKPD